LNAFWAIVRHNPVIFINLNARICTAISSLQAGNYENIVKKLKLPSPPKRPGTAYIQFVQDQLPAIQKSNASLKQSEKFKLIGEEWRKLSSETKQVYETKFKQALENYKREHNKWKESLTNNQLVEIEAAKVQDKQVRVKRKKRLEKRKEMRDLERPKRPFNGFNWFVMEQLKKNEKATTKETFREAGRLWRVMSPEQKKPYIDKAQPELEKYTADIQAWKEKMKKSGKENLLSPTKKSPAKTAKKRTIKRKVVKAGHAKRKTTTKNTKVDDKKADKTVKVDGKVVKTVSFATDTDVEESKKSH